MKITFKNISIILILFNILECRTMDHSTSLREFYTAPSLNDDYINTLINHMKKKDVIPILLQEFMKFVKINTSLSETNKMYPDLSDLYKEKDDFKNVIIQNIEKILKTNSGRFLICSLLYLMKTNNRNIQFELARPDEGITTNPRIGVVYLNLNDLHSQTDFYIYNPGELTIMPEDKTFPDVYLFHELLHYKHFLEDRGIFGELELGRLPQNIQETNDDITGFNDDFPTDPPSQNPDYEEMRTIIGIPFNNQHAKYTICENSYRCEMGLFPRVNLLDASQQPLPKKTQNRSQILKLIKKAQNYYPTTKRHKI